MSPYRVAVEDKDGKVKVFASMLSVNKNTGNREIYIVEKLVASLTDIVELTSNIAYRMTTKNNSQIVDSYIVNRTADLRNYELSRITGRIGDIFRSRTISEKERTLMSCMIRAMNNFLVEQDLTVIGVY